MTEPLLRVVRGEPTEPELAALTVVLTILLAARNRDPAPIGRATWRRHEHAAGYRSPSSWAA